MEWCALLCFRIFRLIILLHLVYSCVFNLYFKFEWLNYLQNRLLKLGTHLVQSVELKLFVSRKLRTEEVDNVKSLNQSFDLKMCSICWLIDILQTNSLIQEISVWENKICVATDVKKPVQNSYGKVCSPCRSGVYRPLDSGGFLFATHSCILYFPWKSPLWGTYLSIGSRRKPRLPYSRSYSFMNSWYKDKVPNY